jgi:large subunit ribosomal protein L10
MAGLTKNFAEKKPASQKAVDVKSIEDALNASNIAVLVEYRGMTVQMLSGVRRTLRQDNATLNVVKNKLAKIAVKNAGAPDAFASQFQGPLAVLFGNGDQVSPVKQLAKSYKDLKKELVFAGGLLDGQVLTPAEVESLVDMPSLLELQAKLLGGIASPVNGIVAAISGPQRALVNVLDQFAKRQQSMA